MSLSPAFRMDAIGIVVPFLLVLIGQSSGQPVGQYVRYNLTLRIVVEYPESQLTSRGMTDRLFLVGNGFGLSWITPTQLEKLAKDTWQMDFRLKGTQFGYSCQDCLNNATLPVGTKFEYRVHSGDGLVDMVGPNFAIPIPTSNLSSYSTHPRTFHCYPYFFTNVGRVDRINVSSPDPYITTRIWGFYMPPSYFENSYKTYPVLLAYDFGYEELGQLQPVLDNLTTVVASVEEAVIIGSRDYTPILNLTTDFQVRIHFLTPVSSAVISCYQGDFFLDNCNGCIPANITNMHERYVYVLEHCGYYSGQEGGGGDTYLDYYLNEVLPAINARMHGRISTNRENMAVGGCSLGGLMSCHALWTRPTAFHAAACQSSSFWWPTLPNGDNGFNFLNTTLKSGEGARLPQRVYIDVSDQEIPGESDPYYAMLPSAVKVADAMVSSSPQFRWDESLWLEIINGQTHGGYQCLSRMWMLRAILNPPQGGPRNPLKL